MKSKHQQRVEEFMQKAGQDVPSKPTIPDEKTRILRSKLILEEAIETVRKGMGIAVSDKGNMVELKIDNLRFDIVDDANIIELADGCADVSVVTTGTLSAFGIQDEDLLLVVDDNNLSKFDKGYSIREDGKLLKPPSYKPPDIKGVLERQSKGI